MQSGKKLVSLMLAGMIALGAAGCSTGEDTKYVATLADGASVPAGVYLTMLQTSYSQIASEMTEVMDTGEDFLESQTADGRRVYDAIVEEAKGSMAKYLATEQKFTEMGLTLSESENATTDYMMEMYWSYIGEMFTANGVAEESYRMYLNNLAKQNAIFNAIYGEGGSEAVPEEEIKAFFEEDYARVLVIELSRSTALMEEDYNAENAAMEEALEKYKGMLESGEDMKSVYLQYLRDQAEDPDSVEDTAVDSAYTLVSKSMPAFGDDVMEKMFAAPEGEYQYYDDGSSHYLFTRYDVNENENDYLSRKTAMISLLRDDQFQEQLLDWGEALMAEQINQKALDRYTPDKLVMI